MRPLWAPWRIDFIQSPKPSGCILCELPREKRDADNLILYRGRHSFVMMNLYPYNNGHLLISPYAHAAGLEALEDALLLDLMKTLKLSIQVVKEALSCEGMNIGINSGKAAGAGIADHLHWHLVPRWAGDTNFMASLGEVRVIPEHLKTTYGKLKGLFPKNRPRAVKKDRAK